MDSSEAVEISKAAATMECAPYLLPDEKQPSRLARAITLVQEGKVQASLDGVIVQGSDRSYVATPDGCECPASSKGRSKWCYHLVAYALWDRWQTRIAPAYQSVFVSRLPTESVPTIEEDFLPMDGNLHPADNTTPTNDDEAAAEEYTASLAPVLTEAQVPRGDGIMRQRATYRPLAAIIADLSKPLPAACVATRQQQGQTISYLHWWDVRALLDVYAPDWEGSVVELKESQRESVDRAGNISHVAVCTVTYALSIRHAGGMTTREAIGREEGNAIAFGDLSSNASAMAFSRAAAMFGVGVWLREKDGTSSALQKHLTDEVWAALGLACDQVKVDRKEALERLLDEAGVTQKRQVPLSMVRAMMHELQ